MAFIHRKRTNDEKGDPKIDIENTRKSILRGKRPQRIVTGKKKPNSVGGKSCEDINLDPPSNEIFPSPHQRHFQNDFIEDQIDFGRIFEDAEMYPDSDGSVSVEEDEEEVFISNFPTVPEDDLRNGFKPRLNTFLEYEEDVVGSENFIDFREVVKNYFEGHSGNNAKHTKPSSVNDLERDKSNKIFPAHFTSKCQGRSQLDESDTGSLPIMIPPPPSSNEISSLVVVDDDVTKSLKSGLENENCSDDEIIKFMEETEKLIMLKKEIIERNEQEELNLYKQLEVVKMRKKEEQEKLGDLEGMMKEFEVRRLTGSKRRTRDRDFDSEVKKKKRKLV